MTQTQLKGVLFDMDDTLIDWRGFGEAHDDWEAFETPYIERLMAFLTQQEQVIDVTLENFYWTYRRHVQDAWADARSTLRAPHMGRVLMQTLQHFGVDAGISMQACLDAYEWGAIKGVTVFPDVPKMLEKFAAQGLKLGIVTNAFQPMLMRDRELVDYQLIDFFPTTRVSAADAGYLKPHPRIFLHALEQLGTEPAETIFIGDNPIADVRGAQSVGMKAVLRVNHGEVPVSAELAEPDAVIHSLEELPALMKQWFEAS